MHLEGTQLCMASLLQMMVQDSAPGINIVCASWQVVSNHGHPKYTCLYRIRVHGSPAPASSGALPQNDAQTGSLPPQQQPASASLSE